MVATLQRSSLGEGQAEADASRGWTSVGSGSAALCHRPCTQLACRLRGDVETS